MRGAPAVSAIAAGRMGRNGGAFGTKCSSAGANGTMSGMSGSSAAGTVAVQRPRVWTRGAGMVQQGACAETSLRANAREDGFTLIESITAATILLIIAVAVMTTLITTGGWYAKARMRTEASSVASEVMSKILSRNYADIHYADQGVDWPEGIPQSFEWRGFSIDTSMTPTVDPSTGIDMLQIIVTANPSGRDALDPAVSVIRYASGWQQDSANTETMTVPVQVQIVLSDSEGGADTGTLRGARVQLLADSPGVPEVYYAVTDDAGIATFPKVQEAGYFLTCDPRFGSILRPRNFPVRVFPTHGGSSNNPIKAVVKYTLPVVRRDRAAVLRVGAYRSTGWTKPFGSPWAHPPTPYQPVLGLTVYARPNLNDSSSGSGTLGYGTKYPTADQLPNGGIYTGTVNAYGVAVIEIPWTCDPDDGQSWEVWTWTKDSVTGQTTKHTLTSYATGSWVTDLSIIDLPADGNFANTPQWDVSDGLANAVPGSEPQ